MESVDAQFWLIVGCATAILIGLLGVIIPGLPGLALCLAAVLVWALFVDTGRGKWLVFGICTFWFVAGVVIKYAWPGKRLISSGVPRASLLAGALAGIVGFFVIPFLGLPIGFVLGVWAMEANRVGSFAEAWPSTKTALQAVGLAMAVELLFGLLIAITWLVGVVWV